MAKFKYIGQSLTRPDAIQKAIGKVQYLDDIRLPGLLHAAILHPETAHADILSIDTAEAEKMPGVVKVVTGRDCKTLYGDNISDISPMAVKKVRHIGDHVAAVIAQTKRQATEALAKIKVEYKPLPVYTDARAALAPDAVLIHDHAENYWHLPGMGAVPGTNIANTYRLKKGDVEKGFAEADVVVEGEFVYPHGSCAAIEPHGAIVRFNEDGTIDAWSSSICPFIIRDDLAHAYHIPSPWSASASPKSAAASATSPTSPSNRPSPGSPPTSPGAPSSGSPPAAKTSPAPSSGTASATR